MSALYWEMIADRLAADQWSWGKAGYVTDGGKLMHVIDASKGGVRHIVNADDLLAGFLELEAEIARQR